MLNSKFDLYKTEWLDLVFADRNKTYGAYDLRVHYGDNMLKALAITVFGFTVAAVSLTLVFKHDKIEQTKTTVIHISPPPVIVPPKTEKPLEAIKRTDPVKAKAQKPATAVPTNVTTQKFVVMKPTDAPVTTEPPKLDMDMQISSIDHTGDVTKPSTGILDGRPQGDGTGAAGKGDDGTRIWVDGVDVMPEPFGGAAAWSKFLQRNLHYPETDIQGRVIISFIVEKDGHLTDIKVIKGVATELDREALRVLKMAPAWKPGMQNGQPVRVKYTIPIVFQMND